VVLRKKIDILVQRFRIDWPKEVNRDEDAGVGAYLPYAYWVEGPVPLMLRCRPVHDMMVIWLMFVVRALSCFVGERVCRRDRY